MQRYTIFNKNNKICLTNSSYGQNSVFHGRVIDCNPEVLQNTNFSYYFREDCKIDLKLICQKVSIEEVFAFITKKCYFVLAAGGVIRNEYDEILFMYRNGFWDLPKGHWESGESIQAAAKREIIEETGLENVRLGNFVGNSFHTYQMHGRFELKQTFWYEMFASKDDELIPQTQEGIQELRWVSPKQIHDIIPGAHPNIRALVRQYLKRF